MRQFAAMLCRAPRRVPNPVSSRFAPGDERGARREAAAAGVMRLLLGMTLALGAPCGSAAEVEARVREDTPYVQSGMIVVATMLEMARVRGSDFVIDLGSGDGRIVIEAARRFGAHGLGIDYDPSLVKLATDNAAGAGVGDRVSFVQEDIFKSDFSAASVITMYLLPEYNMVLRPRLLAMKPGTRIVSHDFAMGEWKPDAQRTVAVPDKPVGAKKESVIYFWVVPARVAGRWRSTLAPGGREVDFELRQRFQVVSGSARIEGRAMALERATLRGPFLSFRVQDGERALRFNGHVSAGRISGQLGVGERSYRWRALRAE